MEKKLVYLSVCLTVTLLLFNVPILEWLFVPIGRTVGFIIWGVDLFLVAYISVLFFRKNVRVPDWYVTIFASMFIWLVLIYFVVAIDRLIISNIQIGIIFPSNTEAIYENAEFTITAKINSLGIRDYETSLKKKTTHRILAVGDSYTFGWGVDLDSTWVKLTEKSLQDSGYDVEFLNLGRSGTFTKQYADLAEYVIPILKPDLVVVAILQGNDVYQAIKYKKPSSGNSKFYKSITDQIVETIIPNTQKLIADRSAPRRFDVKSHWVNEVSKITSNLTQEESDNLNKLDAQILQLARKGLVNPALINRSLRHPDMFILLNDQNSEEFKKGAQQITSDLKRIKDVADQHDVEIILVSVPYKVYSSSKALDYTSSKFGLNFPSDLPKLNTSDQLFRKAALDTELRYYQFTNQFIKVADSTELYYKIDGHFNVEGNKLFSEFISEILDQRLKERN